ncbi:MAG: nitroreductase/quinone reductase family protein [Phototrophicaceae bacterium]|jgi:deazaflavin-dependent oxidoreductase (nitroreductase family)
MSEMNLNQWLYRGKHPNWIARILNRIWAIIAASGITANFVETLEVVGRKSGKRISFPVVLAIVDKQRYLVSMLGDNVQWVLNVRAANGKVVMYSGNRREVQLQEIPVDQRAPILKAYLQRAPGARAHIPVDKDAPLAEFEKIAADYPVFHIVDGE